MEETKTCSRCGKTLPVSEFHKHARSADGLQRYCKLCKKELNKARYKSISDNKKHGNPALASFQPRELIAELRARGYKGQLQYTQTITL